MDFGVSERVSSDSALPHSIQGLAINPLRDFSECWVLGLRVHRFKFFLKHHVSLGFCEGVRERSGMKCLVRFTRAAGDTLGRSVSGANYGVSPYSSSYPKK